MGLDLFDIILHQFGQSAYSLARVNKRNFLRAGGSVKVLQQRIVDSGCRALRHEIPILDLLSLLILVQRDLHLLEPEVQLIKIGAVADIFGIPPLKEGRRHVKVLVAALLVPVFRNDDSALGHLPGKPRAHVEVFGVQTREVDEVVLSLVELFD